MSTHAEDVVLALLDEVEAVEALAMDGLPMEAFPTESLRPVVSWAIDYYFKSGRLQAPTKDATIDTWVQVLDQAEVTLGDGTETDTIEWAIDDLKANYAMLRGQQFNKSFSIDLYEATNEEKVDALARAAYELTTLALSLSSKQEQSDLIQGVEDSWRRYESRRDAPDTIWGLTLGLPEIDAFLGGIHDGEVCTLAAPPKTGKSYLLDRIAYEMSKREPTVLFTLENSVDMTIDRMVCMALSINADRYRKGECDEAEVYRIEAFREKVVKEFEGRLWIIRPEIGHTTMQAMMRQAEMLGCKNVLIDQLTFVEHPDPARKGRPEIIRDLMHELKTLASAGRYKMRVVIAHQINREGVKSARKSGFLNMEDLAEGSEVERTSDFVLGLYQSNEDRAVEMAKLQVMASRRTDVKVWSLSWNISSGMVSVNGEVSVDD